MNLSQKTKYVSIVIRVKGYFPNVDKIKEWCCLNTEQYSFILHEKDISISGEIEEPHAHLVLVMKKSDRLSTTLNSLCNYLSIPTTGVMIDKTVSYEGNIQYLIHKNDLLKTPHDISDIISNLPKEELKTIIDSEGGGLTFDYIQNLCFRSNYISDVIKVLGFQKFNMYRATILLIWNDVEKIKDYRPNEDNKGTFGVPKARKVNL